MSGLTVFLAYFEQGKQEIISFTLKQIKNNCDQLLLYFMRWAAWTVINVPCRPSYPPSFSSWPVFFLAQLKLRVFTDTVHSIEGVPGSTSSQNFVLANFHNISDKQRKSQIL